ncbi:MAG: MFS transporter, partial [Caldilineaceae bacterium]
MSAKPTLPLGRQIAYAVGQLGWSTLVNIIGLELVYFYLPPSNAGLPTLITTVVFLGVLNAITLIAASGRLLDAITDPLIASWSDRSKHPQGRRIPFMKWAALPTAVFCLLMFLPPAQTMSGWNIGWLVVVQACFYIALTFYVTPFFALLPELGHTANQRLNLSTWISITYALGIILAAQTPVLADVMQSTLGLADRLTALQYAIGSLA